MSLDPAPLSAAETKDPKKINLYALRLSNPDKPRFERYVTTHYPGLKPCAALREMVLAQIDGRVAPPPEATVEFLAVLLGDLTLSQVREQWTTFLARRAERGGR